MSDFAAADTLVLRRWAWSAGGRPRTESVVCVPNIGPRERRRRLISGIVMFAIAAAAGLALALAGVDRWWGLALILPLLGSAEGFWQAREKT